MLTEILFKTIVKEELPKYQTQEYITLRSKLGLSAFPFDDINLSNQENEASQEASH